MYKYLFSVVTHIFNYHLFISYKNVVGQCVLGICVHGSIYIHVLAFSVIGSSHRLRCIFCVSCSLSFSDFFVSTLS